VVTAERERIVSILIKVISLPTEREWIDVRVFRDGTAIVTGERAHRSNHDVIEPTPHGRLIDADALVADLKGQVKRVFCIGAVSEADFWIERNEAFKEALWKNWCESFYEYLDGRPTVIEAEVEE